MHCRSCEILIEEELKKIPGVNHVSVNHQTGFAEISCDCAVDEQTIAMAVKKAGYSLGEEKKIGLFSKNRQDYIDLGVAFFIATALFLIAKTWGVFNLGNSISGSYSSLPIVFLVGLTAGISTCMALVGGLVLGASARFSVKNPNASGIERFKPHLFFNLGRIASYFVLGGVIGLAGSFFQLSTSVLGTVTVAVGLVMLLLGGQLIDIFPFLKRISFTLPKGLHKILGVKERSQVEYSNKNSAVLGALTFFLPCGFTQAMQLFAMSTGSAVSGALTMGVFALGTTPGLLSLGGLTSAVKGSGSRIFFKTAGVVVILLAFFNVSNGLNLLGITPNILGVFASSATSDNVTEDPNVTLVNGVQEVRMTQESYGYSPNKFTIKRGVPVRWIVTSTNIYSCASSLLSEQLGIRKGLQLGENFFNFTPQETGTIRFSCAMGMYTGSFNVVDENTDSGSFNTKNIQNTPSGASSCGSSGGCGCGSGKTTGSSQTNGQTTAEGDIQVLKTTYTNARDISPNQFSVKVNQPVRLEIVATDDGRGCMGSITIPNLTRKIEPLTKGETIIFEFTPTAIGAYNITCAMGMPRGQIIVN